MNHYEIKQQERKERYLNKSVTLSQKSSKLHDAGMDALKQIPFGQPILRDHYSAKGDRAYRARAVGKIEKSFEIKDKANHYAQKAESVGTGGISSDDPDVVSKLQEKLEKQLKDHETIKRLNSEARKNGTEKPCPAYMISNSNGRINATKERIKQLTAKSTMQLRETIVGVGFTCREDLEENRIMFEFEGKPNEEIRKILKSYGFKWSPTRNAWVRQLTNSGRYATDQVISILK